MTPSEISALGEALYGKRWQLPLARDLGTSYNVVHDWATGERKPSRRYQEKLRGLASHRPTWVAEQEFPGLYM